MCALKNKNKKSLHVADREFENSFLIRANLLSQTRVKILYDHDSEFNLD